MPQHKPMAVCTLRARLRQSSRYRFHISTFSYIENCLENFTVLTYFVNPAAAGPSTPSDRHGLSLPNELHPRLVPLFGWGLISAGVAAGLRQQTIADTRSTPHLVHDTRAPNSIWHLTPRTCRDSLPLLFRRRP